MEGCNISKFAARCEFRALKAETIVEPLILQMGIQGQLLPETKYLKWLVNLFGLKLMAFNFFDKRRAVELQKFSGLIFDPVGFF